MYQRKKKTIESYIKHIQNLLKMDRNGSVETMTKNRNSWYVTQLLCMKHTQNFLRKIS